MSTPSPLPQHSAPTRGPARPGPYIISGILLVISIALPLIPPIYARWDPAIFGMPFFYWYQMLWVLIDAGLLWICYAIITKEDRRRREEVRGTRAAGIHSGNSDAARPGDARDDEGGLR